MEAHCAEAHGALAHGGILRARDRIGRVIDEVLKNVVEELHRIRDELRVILPIIEVFEIEG